MTLVASGLDDARPLAHIARAAIRRLADKINMAASVPERAGDDLVITAFEYPADLATVIEPNQRIPYAPPFGIAFAAWDDADEQQAWIRRGAAGDAKLHRRLQTVLTRTRERGYDIDWMTPALSQAAHAIGTLSGDGLPHTCVPSSISCVWNSRRPTQCLTTKPGAHTPSPQFRRPCSTSTIALPSYSQYIRCET